MEKHYRSLKTKVIVNYFQEHFPTLTLALLQDLHPEINSLNNPLKFITDNNNWVSSDVVIGLFKNAKRLSQDENIAFKIGCYAATHQKFGYLMRILTPVFGNPRRALKRIQVIINKFNRNKSVEVLLAGKCRATIKFRYFRHIPTDEDFCLFNQGILQAMQTIWKLPPGNLEETRCYFRGDDYCEYLCTWKERSILKKFMRKIFMPWGLLSDTFKELERNKELLKKKFDEVHYLNLQLKEKIDQLMALPETCMAAFTAVDVKGLLQVTLNFLTRVAQLDRAGVFLLNELTNLLEIHSVVGIDKKLYEKIKDFKISLSKADDFVAQVATNGIPLVISDVDQSRYNKENPLIKLLQPKAFILSPITVQGKVIGVIWADRIRRETHIAEIDQEKLMNLAYQVTRTMESALLKSKLGVAERWYQKIVENAYEGIWVIDEAGIIKFANQRFQEIIGEYQLEGKRIFSFFEKDNKKLVANVLAQNKKGNVALHELELLTPERKPVKVIMSSVPIMENGQYIGSFAMFTDITAIKRMERQLLQHQKMEAMGTLAEGWARNFNDILVNITVLNGLRLAETQEGDPAYADLKQIEREVRKGADLIYHLLSFGRRQFKPQLLDINLIIDKIVKLSKSSHRNLRIVRKRAEDLPMVEVDPGQLELALLNLLLMTQPLGAIAQEVMITADQVVLSEKFCQIYNRLPGHYIYISINAPHLILDELLKATIFKPFMVVDEVGLETQPSIVSIYSVIKNHHGMIEMDSEIALGTTFHIYLPVPKRASVPREPQSLHFIRGTGTILLVDDEEPVRAVGARILERLGYKVILASNGQQALNLVQKPHESIDLVVLDMVMPGLSGRETFYRLKEVDPGIKILLYSAHSMDEDVHLMLENGALGFIKKPYRMATLSQKIAEMLSCRPRTVRTDPYEKDVQDTLLKQS